MEPVLTSIADYVRKFAEADPRGEAVVFSETAASLPNDPMLAGLGVRACMGVPLLSSQRKPLGLLMLMSRTQFEDPEQAESILQVVGARCGAELERLRVERAVRRRRDALH